VTRDGRRRLIADPLTSFAGCVNGVYAWAGLAGQEPPPQAPAGAWYFNRTTGLIDGSGGLLDLYGVAPQDRRQQRLTAEAFTRLLRDAGAGTARPGRARGGVPRLTPPAPGRPGPIFGCRTPCWPANDLPAAPGPSLADLVTS
jgi:hypothetical protein